MFWIPLFSAFVFWETITIHRYPLFLDMQLFLFFGDQSYFLPFFGRGIWSEEKKQLTRWTEFWKEISERLECPIVEWSNNIFFKSFWICPKKSIGPPKKNSCTRVETKTRRMSFSKVAFSGSAVRMISPWGGVIPKLDGQQKFSSFFLSFSWAKRLCRYYLAQFHDVWWDLQLSWQVDISSKSKEKVKARETQCIKDRICAPWKAIDGC